MFDQPLQCHCHVALTCSADAMPTIDMFSVTCSSHSMFIVPCNCSSVDGCSLLMADCVLSSTSGSLHCELVLDINGTLTCSLLANGNGSASSATSNCAFDLRSIDSMSTGRLILLGNPFFSASLDL